MCVLLNGLQIIIILEKGRGLRFEILEAQTINNGVTTLKQYIDYKSEFEDLPSKLSA